MIITCLKCKTSYEVDDKLISEDGKKVHCSNCGEIWVVYKEKPTQEAEKTEKAIISPPINESTIKEEVIPANNFEKDDEPVIETVEYQDEIKRNKKDKEISADNIDEIFSSFSIRRGRDIDVDSYTPEPKKKGSGKLVNAFFFFLSFLIVVAFCLYYLRFDITKNYPITKPLYEKLNINATYFGQGLVFKDVTKLEYDDGFYPQMIITGFIVNQNKEETSVPTISVKFLNADNEMVEEIRYNTRVQSLEPGDVVQFDVSLDKPEIPIKYVEITFVK